MINGGEGVSASQQNQQLEFNNVYVLSLPGFVWTKSNDTSGPRKYGHSCEVIGNRHMLSIGGHDPFVPYFSQSNTTDNFTQGLGIFDMVNLGWIDTYDAKAAPYEMPEAIKEWYSRP